MIGPIIWAYFDNSEEMPLSAMIFHIIYFGVKFVVVVAGVASSIVLEAIVTLAFVSIISTFAAIDIAFVVMMALQNVEFFNGAATWLGIRSIAEPIQWAVIDGSLVVISLYLLGFLLRYSVSMRNYKRSYGGRSSKI